MSWLFGVAFLGCGLRKWKQRGATLGEELVFQRQGLRCIFFEELGFRFCTFWFCGFEVWLKLTVLGGRGFRAQFTRVRSLLKPFAGSGLEFWDVHCADRP